MDCKYNALMKKNIEKCSADGFFNIIIFVSSLLVILGMDYDFLMGYTEAVYLEEILN